MLILLYLKSEPQQMQNLLLLAQKMYASVVTLSTQENNIITAATKNKIQTNY